MSKKILLNESTYAIVDDEDYDLVSRFNWSLTTTDKKYKYAQCSMYMGTLNSRHIYCAMYLHRLILRPPKGKYTDHINHDGLDCRQINLRICTNSQNQYNRQSHIRHCSSKFKGVSWSKRARKWKAGIKVNQKSIYLGSFENENKAAHAYDKAAIKYFGEFAYLNFSQ